MKFKFSYVNDFTRYIGIGVFGMIGVMAVNPVIVQASVTEKASIQVAQATSIEGNWRLANMTEPPFPTPMVPSTELTADFVGDRVSGTGGCNRFNGGFKTDGNQISVGPLASTFKACEESIMTQESRYLKALQAAKRYEVDSNGLQIFYQTDQGEGVLRFVRQSVQGLW